MSDDWQTIAEIPRLAAGEAQVWRIDLEDTLAPEDYLKMLSAEEVERAGKLRVGQVRMQFLVGRTALRKLLGAELGIAPKEISIVLNKYGKPQMGGAHNGRLHFNVTHARSTVLVALSLAGPVGIDIEYLDRGTDVLEVAQHSLTPGEYASLLAISDTESRNRAFFECWTRKEAVVKADGRGLSLPLTSFEVPVGRPCQSYPVEVKDAEGDLSARYYVSDIGCHEQTACAIAVVQPGELRLLTFNSHR